jgi:CubicO group peptidase (beta-lactamase class C family)
MRDYALDDGFDSPQNRSITWRHMLWQTSEWEGTLWDKPDLVDRNRQVGPGADNRAKGQHRDLRVPGTFYEYNDVRVNRLALSLLQVFRRPLSEVLAERVMGPIGASDGWAWHAYRNAWFEIDGERMPSVPGGGHWGGGLVISAADLARVGRLVRLDGEWEGTRVLPAGWASAVRTACPHRPDYGLLLWVNPRCAHNPSAPEACDFMVGAGANVGWIDDELDLVAVMRWIAPEAVDVLAGKLLRAIL